jgi:hypothetical protein
MILSELMFKNFFMALAPLLVLCDIGCRSLPPLPPVNIQETGWQVRQGQAVWRLGREGREIAGEVLVATKDANRCFVQFSKTPFPLLLAQAEDDRWQVEFPTEHRHYAGRGTPSQRLIWLYLPRVLTGQPPPKDWRWHQDANGWRLENLTTGESVEGFFNQ